MAVVRYLGLKQNGVRVHYPIGERSFAKVRGSYHLNPTCEMPDEDATALMQIGRGQFEIVSLGPVSDAPVVVETTPEVEVNHALMKAVQEVGTEIHTDQPKPKARRGRPAKVKNA